MLYLQSSVKVVNKYASPAFVTRKRQIVVIKVYFTSIIMLFVCSFIFSVLSASLFTNEAPDCAEEYRHTIKRVKKSVH
ncbi:hypothetical protein V5799_004203 [Amblyomma americanum]|uniref:Uncharacterized protein n=1 Tax=Amblyomma americanum TaxID=6943 RepID=A0AAQ4D6S6_AMBAM